MRNERNKGKGRKKIFLTALALSMIAFGLWFSGTNAASFLKGYLLFKSGQVNSADFSVKTAPSNETLSLPEEQGEADADDEVLYPVRPEQVTISAT